MLSWLPRYGKFLAAIYAIVWLIAAYQPLDFQAWALEQIGVVFALFVLWRVQVNAPVSHVSLTLIFLFLCAHAVGTHYTYAQVPLAEVAQSHFGISFERVFGWTRNHYDRIVHFLFGLFITLPVLESLRQHNQLRGAWYYVMPFALVFSVSTLYELGEWVAVLLFGGELGIHFLGVQGDLWDAQKDMALAGAGSALTLLLVALFGRRHS
jgi:putative membrane protein